MPCGVGSRTHILWRSGATPHLRLLIMHVHLRLSIDFILRTFMNVFNPQANSFDEYGKGSEKMDLLKVADQGVGLHCSEHK